MTLYHTDKLERHIFPTSFVQDCSTGNCVAFEGKIGICRLNASMHCAHGGWAVYCGRNDLMTGPVTTRTRLELRIYAEDITAY